MSITYTQKHDIKYDDIEFKVNELVATLYALGANDNDIFSCFIDKDNLIDAMQSITEANEWEYIASLGNNSKHGFMYDITENKKRIEKCYSTRNTYELHSGSSYGFIMRKMQEIAFMGFDTFAKNTIEHIKKIIEKRNGNNTH